MRFYSERIINSTRDVNVKSRYLHIYSITFRVLLFRSLQHPQRQLKAVQWLHSRCGFICSPLPSEAEVSFNALSPIVSQ